MKLRDEVMCLNVFKENLTAGEMGIKFIISIRITKHAWLGCK